MRIVYAAAEVAPFAKTGGLADVAGALPKFLAQLGHHVAVIMPFYRHVRLSKQPFTDTGRTVSVPIMNRTVEGRILESRLPGSTVPVYFIGNDPYFDRDELYKDRARDDDYEDNCERFVFFSRALLEAVEALGLRPDILHANDWQTGLLPTYVKTLYSTGHAVSGVPTLFTIHNLGYQGLFHHSDMALTGLDPALFNWRQLEYYGRLGLLKAGLVFADLLNAVSPRYAEEIQTEELGLGHDGVLRERAHDLYGVINGVDYAVWNPAVDDLVPAKYSPERMGGKAVCKRQLLRTQKLPERKATPLIGMISRLVPQKGFDILGTALDDLMEIDLQLVVLGTGDKEVEDLLAAAAKKYPAKLAVNLTFNNKLAHEIEAGSDLFLMPSRYEPGGLNQLYSLKYGTVPVVRATGGLADTIIDCTPYTLAAGTATGFTFDKYNPVDLLAAVERAVALYRRRADWARLVSTGMAQDWSWARSAREYVALYEKAMKK